MNLTFPNYKLPQAPFWSPFPYELRPSPTTNMTPPLSKYKLPPIPVIKCMPPTFKFPPILEPKYPLPRFLEPSIPTVKQNLPSISHSLRYYPTDLQRLPPAPTSALEAALPVLLLISLILAPLFLACVYKLSEIYEKWKAERNPQNTLAHHTVVQIQPHDADIIYLPIDLYKMAESSITHKATHQIDVSRK